MRTRTIVVALLLLGAFFNTAFTHAYDAFPLSRSEPCPVTELFDKARALAATLPVHHSTEQAPYTETLVYPKYRQPRTRMDFV